MFTGLNEIIVNIYMKLELFIFDIEELVPLVWLSIETNLTVQYISWIMTPM